MSEYNQYLRFKQTDLILRDVLAVDRTILANERTFLAYMRTALSLFVTGVSFTKFLGNFPYKILGWLFVALGFFTFIIGIRRYCKIYRRISFLNRIK